MEQTKDILMPMMRRGLTNESANQASFPGKENSVRSASGGPRTHLSTVPTCVTTCPSDEGDQGTPTIDRLSHVLDWIKTPEAQVRRSKLEKEGLATQRLIKRNTSNRRYAKDAGFRLKSKFTARLNSYMNKRLIFDKPTRFGCSQWELRDHMESLFKHGMTWKNYGTYWEVDHVCPAARFNFMTEILSCFHYTNLRPRLKALNRIDGKLFRFREYAGGPIFGNTLGMKFPRNNPNQTP
jgi:hypothetical protein